MEEKLSYKALMENAKAAEKEGEEEQAIKTYQQAIKQSPSNEAPYQRLMILYRKQKAYRKEMAIINTAILFFTKHYRQRHASLPRLTAHASRISKALSQKLGLTDKKGNAMHLPEPLVTWEKRKQLLAGKLK